eukprot:6269521-Lingulodinium_polyedra.AAC.1
MSTTGMRRLPASYTSWSSRYMPFRMRRSGTRATIFSVSSSSPQQVWRASNAPSSVSLASLMAPGPRRA